MLDQMETTRRGAPRSEASTRRVMLSAHRSQHFKSTICSIFEVFSCCSAQMDRLSSDLLTSTVPTEPGAHGPDQNMIAEMLDERHRNRTQDVDAHMEEVAGPRALAHASPPSLPPSHPAALAPPR